MSDDETPFTPGASAEADAATPENLETPGDEIVGGKLIHADVFLSRLAERRQAEQDYAEDDASVINTILGALEDIGLDPNTLAPDFVSTPRTSSQAMRASPVFGPADSLDLEALAVEELFLSELRDGLRPSLSDYIQRYPAQREALRRMAAHMPPRELAGLDAQEEITPTQEEAARAGQEAGTRKALREALMRGARRERGMAQRRVAEEQASYTAGNANGEESPKKLEREPSPLSPPEESRPKD